MNFSVIGPYGPIIAVRDKNEPSKSHPHLYVFNKPINSLYFRYFVVSVLFAHFHFKVILKLL